MRKSISVLFFLFVLSSIAQECPKIEAIMVDACGNEPLNEFAIISTGDGFLVDNLQFGFNPSNNVGAVNANINDGFISCGLTQGNPDVYTGCNNIIAVGPGDFVPADSYLVLQTSDGADATYDFSALCEDDACIYVVANSCTRTVGAFTNKDTSSPGPRDNTLAITGTSCVETVTFNTQDLISSDDGNYFIPPNTYGIESPDPCVAPPIAPAQGTVPVFDDFDAICAGDESPLPSESNNGITGEWIPEFNNQETTTYTFLPNEEVCGENIEVTIEVIPNELPTFSFATSLCIATENFPELPNVSDNSISGTWFPNEIEPDITEYTFTPSSNCSEEVVISFNFEEAIIPEFTLPSQLCEGSAFVLPAESENGISGSWLPEFDPAGSAEYTFTPNEDFCAEEISFFIEIISGEGEDLATEIPEDIEIECGNELPEAPEFNPEEYCGISNIFFSETIEEGECPVKEVVTRSWLVEDLVGNEVGLFQQQIVLIDTTPPVFTELPENRTISCEEGWPEDAEVEVSDACSDVSLFIEEDIIESDECPQNFTLIRTFIAVDECGNESTAEQLIQIIDNTPPVFDEDFPTELRVACGEVPAPETPNVSDACSDIVAISFTEDKLDNCEEGKTTQRVWEAIDKCGNTSTFIQLVIEDCDPIVYSGISPNDDGINDYLVIENITCFPNNTFQVFNRYGRKVLNVDNYNNEDRIFSGLNQSGKKLVTGSYFYVFNYLDPRTNSTTTKKGWIYVNY